MSCHFLLQGIFPTQRANLMFPASRFFTSAPPEYSQWTNTVVIASCEHQRDSAMCTHVSILPQGLSGWHRIPLGNDNGKESTCQSRRCRFDPWEDQRCPGGGKWLATPVFLPENFRRQEEPGGLQSMGSQSVGHDWVRIHILPQISFPHRLPHKHGLALKHVVCGLPIVEFAIRWVCDTRPVLCL